MFLSQTPKFRSPVPPLRLALDALPGYPEHEAALIRVAAALGSAVAARDAASHAKEGLGQAVLEQLLTDNAKPADLLKVVKVLASHAGLVQAERVVAVLDKAQDALLAERDAILQDSVDALFKHLDGSLQDAVALARSIDLAGVTDAESAISAGKTEAWATFTAARTETFLIRAAQLEILSGLVRDSTVTQHRLTFGTYRNYADLHPQWLAAKRAAAGSHSADGSFTAATEPWPADPPEQFLWAVQNHDVEQWVPTAQETRDAYTNAHKAASYVALDPDEKRRADQAAAKYDRDLGYARHAAETSGSHDDY